MAKEIKRENFRVILKDDDGKLVRAWEFEDISKNRFQMEVGRLVKEGLLPKGPDEIKKFVEVQKY